LDLGEALSAEAKPRPTEGGGKHPPGAKSFGKSSAGDLKRREMPSHPRDQLRFGEENKGYVFDGLFPIQEVEQYSSKRPYDFNAGGKGLELMLMKTYGERFGFHLGMESWRCVHMPSGSDQCPGRISECPHCRVTEDCLASGGSAFWVSLPASPEGGHAGDPAPSTPNQGP
jgi:hypothetical protein